MRTPATLSTVWQISKGSAEKKCNSSLKQARQSLMLKPQESEYRFTDMPCKKYTTSREAVPLNYSFISKMHLKVAFKKIAIGDSLKDLARFHQ
jgi:hypothetical protein